MTEKNTGLCDECGKEFSGYIEDELTFCSPECDIKWYRRNISGNELYEADKTLYCGVKLMEEKKNAKFL